jgi:membrane-associated phospholipid phosphatase
MRPRIPQPPSVNDTYSILVIVSLTLGIIALWLQGKVGTFLLFNPVHNEWLNHFFKAETFLGDGWFSIILGVLLILTREKERGMQVLAGFALSGLLAQLIKNFVYAPRPMALIPGSTYPYFLPDYTLNAWNSFPSGHTTSVFCFTAIMAWTSSSNTFKFWLAIIALLTGYSRVYLGQHFPDDVISGALLGLFTAYAIRVFWPTLSRSQSKARP